MIGRLLLAFVSTAAVAAVFSVAAATGALNWTGEPLPWPGHRLTVALTDPAWELEVRAAVRKLNELPVDLKVDVTDDPTRAGAVITTISQREMSRRCVPGTRGDAKIVCSGLASTIGYRGRRETIWLVDHDQVGMDPAGRVRLVAHEIAHVLGLKHRHRGCSLMSPLAGEDTCRRDQLAGLCGPARQDVAALQQLYGRRPRGAYTPFCVPWEAFVSAQKPRSRASSQIRSTTSSSDRPVLSIMTASSAGRSGSTARLVSR